MKWDPLLYSLIMYTPRKLYNFDKESNKIVSKTSVKNQSFYILILKDGSAPTV